MMVVILRWLLLIFFANFCVLTYSANEVRVVCYYTNWSVYRPGTAKFSPQNINPYLCTHLIYAFGGFTKENTLKPFDKYQDIEKGGYAKFTGLKTYNKNLKTLLAIGGWNEGSSRFSPMVASPERRRELVKNIIKFLRQYHFDGLDLDWEYPSFRDGGKPRDKENYAYFVQELREEFEREFEKTGRPRLLLTMAVPAGIEYINKGYDVPKLTKYLDWMNILSYDYHSAFEPAVNHHAPLYPIENDTEYSYEVDLNIDYTIKHYLKVGAVREKLVLGIPTYGRSYTLFNPDANDIGSPADGPGTMGDATRENGYLAFYEICDNIKKENWTVKTPYPGIMGPYAYKGNQWVGYDDEDISRKKARYVIENNLGGIMFWSIDNDDFRGNCYGKPYPLIEAAKEELLSVYKPSEKSKATTAKAVISRNKGRRKPVAVNKVKESESGQSSSREPAFRRNRLRASQRKNQQNAVESRPKKERVTETRRRPASTTPTYTTPSYTTPSPPTTPDLGSDFKCEDEGFFPHPRDCKKYFWCLNGPSETGIVAHQFTCPAGLYFNKAADSCDYSQNVLCNKKKAKSSTTTAATTTTKLSTLKSTQKTTSTSTTTTTTEAAEYDDEEYEYEDEEIDSKDPKVIKELLDLIKKAGGIEELEKQLQSNQDETGNSDSTTKSTTLQRNIYESVLHRVSGKTNNLRTTPKYTSLNRNRGYQNSEPVEEKVKTTARGRPQYTYISRQQLSNTNKKGENVKEEEEEESVTAVSQAESPLTEKPDQKEYVTIRRNRFRNSPGENGASAGRAKAVEDSVEKTTPKYVTIRRRPSTSEVTTIQYSNEDLEAFTLLNKETVKSEDSKNNNDDSSLTDITDDIALTDNNSNTLKLDSTTERTQKEFVTVTANYVEVTSSNFRNSYETTTEAVTQRSKPFVQISRKNKPTSRPRTTTEPPKVSESVTSKYKFTTEIGENAYDGTRQRTHRGKSRFAQTQTSVATNRPYRNRPILTTESYEDSDQDILKQNRKYRPDISVEVADLSSLTAADFSVVNGDRGRNSRRRVRLTTTTDNTIGGKRATDSIGSYSRNVKISKPLIDSSTTRSQSQYEINNNNSTRNEVVRKRILRRYRPTSTTETPSTTLETNTRSKSRFGIKRNKTLADNDKNNSVVSDELEFRSNEDEDIKLSESIIRESNDVGGVNNKVTNSDGKRRQKVVKRLRINGANGNDVTEPSVIVRTRKIIRKLTTTEKTDEYIDGVTESNNKSTVSVLNVEEEFEKLFNNSDDKIVAQNESTLSTVATTADSLQNSTTLSSNENKNQASSEYKDTSTEVIPEIISTTLKITRGNLIPPEQRRRRIQRPKTPTNYLSLVDGEKESTLEKASSTTLTSTPKFNFKRKNVLAEKKETRKIVTTPKISTGKKQTKPTRHHFIPKQFRSSSTTESTTLKTVTVSSTENNEYLEDSTVGNDTENTEKNNSDSTTIDITSTDTYETTTMGCNKNNSDCESAETESVDTTTMPAITTTDSVSTTDYSTSEYLTTELSTTISNEDSVTQKIDVVQNNVSDTNLNQSTTTPASLRGRFKNFPVHSNTKNILNRPRTATASTTTSTTEATRRTKNYKKKDSKRRFNSITSTTKVNKETPPTVSYESKSTSQNTQPVTEQITTLHHIFAETEKIESESSTEMYNETTTETSTKSGSSTKKTEKLIEVSRIVEVHIANETEKQNKTIEKDATNKHLDKIGVISRVTVIKVVDGNNTISENDTLNNEVRPELNQTVLSTPENEISTENTNKSSGEVTIKPNFATEASTIALEGLFPTELLESKKERKKVLEIITPPRSTMGELMMPAKIVEIAPKNLKTIKIVPITFEKVLEPVRKV